MPSTGSPYAASRFTDGQTGYCGYYFRAVIDSTATRFPRRRDRLGSTSSGSIPAAGPAGACYAEDWEDHRDGRVTRYWRGTARNTSGGVWVLPTNLRSPSMT